MSADEITTAAENFVNSYPESLELIQFSDKFMSVEANDKKESKTTTDTDINPNLCIELNGTQCWRTAIFRMDIR